MSGIYRIVPGTFVDISNFANLNGSYTYRSTRLDADVCAGERWWLEVLCVKTLASVDVAVKSIDESNSSVSEADRTYLLASSTGVTNTLYLDGDGKRGFLLPPLYRQELAVELTNIVDGYRMAGSLWKVQPA